MFPINGEPSRNFYAGLLPDGRQALITLSETGEVVLAVFGSDGELIQTIHELLSSPPIVPDDEHFQEYLRHKFGFTPEPVRVRTFRLCSKRGWRANNGE